MLTTVTWILVLLWKSEQIMPHSILKQPDLTALDLKESHVDLQTAKVSLENMTLIIKSTDDQLMTAKLVKEDDCIFTGYMVGCPESTVVVTGCPGEAQSVQIQSHVFGDMAFTTEDGVVKSVVLNNELKRNKRNTASGCVCNDVLDYLYNVNCKKDNWCYVAEDAGCENMEILEEGSYGAAEQLWRSTTPCSNSSPPDSDVCDYQCKPNGSCVVKYTGPLRSGQTSGSCFPRSFGGSCSGTPRECQECNSVLTCPVYGARG